MSQWIRDREKKEMLDRINKDRNVSLRHVSRSQGRALEELAREGKVGSYMGDSGARRYYKK